VSFFRDWTQNKLKRTTVYASAAAVVFYLLDQLTKELIVREIPLHAVNAVIPGFFNITHITNPGAAWSILAGKAWLLLTISIAAFIAILLFLRQLSERYTERVYALLFICSGIAGNCTDRIFRGEVVDFLQFHIGQYYWPSFNVADSCITCGVIVFVASSLFRPGQPKKEQAAEIK